MARVTNYTDYDREGAVAAYVIKGTYSGASEVTGIPQDTIRTWHDKRESWWTEVEERIRREHEAEHRASIREIIVKGLHQLDDRIQNGDYVADKEGNLTRKPVNARDLVIATGTMIDKLRLSLGQPTSIAGKTADTAQNKLEALRDAARQSVKDESQEGQEGGAGHAQSLSKIAETTAH